MGEEQLKILFNGENDEILSIPMPETIKANKRPEKTCAVAIPQGSIENATVENIKKALTSLRDSSYETTKKIYTARQNRTLETDEKSPVMRQYAFCSQQYINAKMALELMDGIGKTEAELSLLCDFFKKDRIPDWAKKPDGEYLDGSLLSKAKQLLL